jgi:hypothetical protein
MSNAYCQILYREGATNRETGPFVIARRWNSQEATGLCDVVIEYGDGDGNSKTEVIENGHQDHEVIRRAIQIFDEVLTGERFFAERYENAEKRAAENQAAESAAKPDRLPKQELSEKAEKAESVRHEPFNDSLLETVYEACKTKKAKAGEAFFTFLKNQGREAMIRQLNEWGITLPVDTETAATSPNPRQRIETLVEEVLDLGATPEEVDTKLMRICATTAIAEIASDDLSKIESALKRFKAELADHVDALG